MYKTLTATDEDVEIIEKAIADYNISKVPYPKNPPWENMHRIIKDSNGDMVAGITSYLIMNNVLSIDVLFVSDGYKNKGYGTLLLKKVEEEAKTKGAYLAQLDTFDFQALSFYQKHGYEIFGTLEDCPALGHKRYYLKKVLKFRGALTIT